MEDWSEELKEKAGKEKEELKRMAKFWDNAIPQYNHEYRAGLTEDAKTTFAFRQLELNKGLHEGIQWNNRLNIGVALANLFMFGANIYLFFH